MALEINHIMNFVKIECRSDNSIRIRAPNKKYYENCSISSRSGDAFQMAFYSEQAIYNEFVRIMGYYKFFLFTNSAYTKSFTCGNKSYVMKNVIDRLMVDYPAKFAISETCISGEITSPICNDSPSLYANDQWVGKYFAVDVDEVGTDLAEIKVHIAILEDPYIVTVPITLYEDECYLFETGWGIVRLNIRALQGNVIPRFVQLRECIMPDSALKTSTCHQIKLEDYIVIPKECPIPSATLSITLDNEIATGIITTNPGVNETISNATLFVFNGQRYVQRTDVDLTGEAKIISFEQEIIRGSYYYVWLLLQNSCGGNSGWLISNIICDNKCVDYDLYSQNFVGNYDIDEQEWVGVEGCILNELIEQNSLSCDYVPPDPCEGVICEDKCIGYDLYSQKCVDGECVLDELIEQNSLSCDYVPPDPCEGVICEDRCIGYDLYSQKCVDGECVTDKLIEENSLSCDYVPECVPKWVCELDIEGKNTGVLIDDCGNRKYYTAKCPIGEEPTVSLLTPLIIGGLGLIGLFKMRSN